MSNLITANGATIIKTFPGMSYVFGFSGSFGGGSLAVAWLDDDGDATAFAFSPVTSGTSITAEAPSSRARVTLTGATAPNIELGITLSRPVVDGGGGGGGGGGGSNSASDLTTGTLPPARIANESLPIAKTTGLTAALATIPQGELFSDAVRTLVSAHAGSNANCGPRAQLGWARFLKTLETGGILSSLVDAACFRTGYNSSTAPKSIRNVAVTVRGVVPCGPQGAIFSANSANSYNLAIPDARGGTMALDFSYAETSAEFATPLALTASTGTPGSAINITTSSGTSNPFGGTVYTANGGSATFSSQIGSIDNGFSIHRYNPLETIAAVASDNAASPTIKAWVNGLAVLTDSTGNLKANSALTSLNIGASQNGSSSWNLPHAGSVASVAVFDRVLSDAENVTLYKALRALDPREHNLVICGDSRSAQLSDASHQKTSWPYLAMTRGDLKDKYRLCNAANNGWTAIAVRDNFAARTANFGPNGTSVKSADCIIWTGANDWLGAYTGSAVWGYVQTTASAARNAGMRAIIATDPESGYTGPQEAERLAYNALLIANPQAMDGLWDIDGLLPLPRRTPLWLNQYHLNGVGNLHLAQNLAAGRIPYNGPTSDPVASVKVGAYKSTDQAGLSAGAYTKITFDTEEYDTGGCFAGSTFTAPFDCFVQVNLSIYVLSGTTGTDILAIYKNGSAHKRVMAHPTVAANTLFNGACLIKCLAGDTLEVYYYGTNSRTITGAANSTWITLLATP